MSYNHIFSEALSLFDRGDYSASEQMLRQILETAPEQPDVLNMLGLIAQTKGVHNEAISYFSAAIRQKNDNPAFYYNLAFSLKAINHLSDAINNFNKVLQLAPHIKETHNELACIYENLTNLTKARKHWIFAIKMSPNYPEANINLAYSYRHDLPEKAFTDLTKLSVKYPSEPLVWYNLGWLLYNQNNFNQSLECAKKSEQLAPTLDTPKYLIGLIHLALKDDDKAKNILLQAELINPNNFDVKLCLADIFSRNNNFIEAETRYKRLIELNSNNFNLHNNYAEMLSRQKRLSEALDEYRKAVIINPKSAEVCNNLGAILRDLKEYDEALGLFFNALSLAPTLPAISINIAETIILLSTDNEEKAKKISANWLKSYPSNHFAKHLNAAMQGDNIENNQIFIEKLFDNFASNYELVMQNLDYSAPLAIRRIAGTLENSIADLGCGSGLVGMAIKKDWNTLIGVDLSSSMLELAKQKNVYKELVKSDIIDFLQNRSDFEWIIAADVLGYIGNPERFIKLCSKKNIIFTIETLDSNNNFQIQKNGRFKHNPNYVENLLKQNGFYDIYKEEMILRTENKVPVKGYIFKAFGDK